MVHSSLVFIACIGCASAFVTTFHGCRTTANQRGAISPRSFPSFQAVDRHCFRLTMQTASASAPKSKSEILDELRKALTPAWEAESAEACVKALDDLKERGIAKRWASAKVQSRLVSQGELKRTLKTELELDELFGLKGVSVDLKYLTVAAFGLSAVFGVGGSLIGGQTGGFVYWLTFLGASIPLVLVGLGSVAPGLIGTGLSRFQWALDPTNTRERRVRHEAAHLLCGYLCGLPMETYQIEPVPSCKFFDRREGNFDAIQAWKEPRPFNSSEVDVLSVVSLSGLMGELTKYDKADGGLGDLAELEKVFFRAEGARMGRSDTREGLTRWGALESRRLLEEHKAELERLCAAMEGGASVEECLAAIEAP